MHARPRLWTLTLVVSAVFWSADGSAERQLTDTRLAFVVGDGDLLGSDDVAPGPGLGQRPEYGARTERWDARPGARNVTHLVTRGRTEQAGLDTSAVLALRLSLDGIDDAKGAASSLEDAGTHVGLRGASHGASWSVRLFPFDSDRLRLGDDPLVAWAGTASRRGESVFVRNAGAVPGAELSVERSAWWTRWRLASAALPNDDDVGTTSRWGGSGCVGLRPARKLSTRFAVGAFDRGRVDQRSVWVAGATLGFTLGDAGAVPLALDMLVYDGAELPLRALPVQLLEVPPGAWAVRGEGTWLLDRRTNGVEHGRASVLSAVVSKGRFVLSATGGRRDVGYLTHTTAGPFTFRVTPVGTVTRSELLLDLSVRYALTPREVALAVDVAITRPATLVAAGRAHRVEAPGQLNTLPRGLDVVPTGRIRFSLGWRASELLSVSSWVEAGHDHNRAKIGPDGAERLLSPVRVGAGGAAQARF